MAGTGALAGLLALQPDWTRPWLQPYAALGRRLLQPLAAGMALPQAANALAGAGWPRFVPQQALPAGVAYESFVQASGQCPLRENAHDFYNALVWLHFPRSKRALGALHAGEIARRGAQPRGALRDALTLFDENGALLLAPRPMWDALRARDWRGLFVTQRGHWSQARLLVFGHGLLEQLQRPRKPLTAHVLPAPNALESIADVDAWLSQSIADLPWTARPFAPLPVLGVPGWCAENAHEAFYDDRFVFRPAGGPERLQKRTCSGVA